MNIAVITGASAGIGRELVYAVDKDARYDEIWVIAEKSGWRSCATSARTPSARSRSISRI